MIHSQKPRLVKHPLLLLHSPSSTENLTQFSSTPPPNIWSVASEIGDGACGFRAISRRIHGDPHKHQQVRSEILQYMNNNRNDPNFHNANSPGINKEYLYILGESPTHYTSYDDYLQIMSHPRAYLGEPEIFAAMRKYDLPINVAFSQSQLPNPPDADPSSIQLLYDPQSKHFSSCVLTPLPPSNPNSASPQV